MQPTDIFSFNGKNTNLSIGDFWRFEFSNLIDLHGFVAEYLVARALGKDEPDNSIGWTDYDILYKSKRIEVKSSAYFQTWRKDGKICQQRTFSIRQKNKNDIYVFCLLLGKNEIDANPLQLEHWEFYVVATKTIKEKCGDNKSISLKRLRSIANPIKYDNLKTSIDKIIE
jgi:hypothetical protein